MQVPPPPAPLPLRIPLRRAPGNPAPRRSALWALGIAAGVHALAIAASLSAVRDGGRRGVPAPRAAPAEQVAYLAVDAWPTAPGRRSDGAPSPAPAPGVSGAPAPSARPPAAADSVATAAISLPAVPGAQGTPPAAAPASGSGGTRTRLGPELGDARLVVPRGAGSIREPGETEPYLAEFRAALNAFNDSIQDLTDRERRAASWTWTDPAGRVWGFRQGKLMVEGEETISVEMRGDRDQDALGRQQARQRREGADQAERLERERSIRERDRAVRAARERERRSGSP